MLAAVRLNLNGGHYKQIILTDQQWAIELYLGMVFSCYNNMKYME